SWKEARDPMGWLYGAAVLALQAGLTSAKSGNTILTGSCIASGAVSLLLLLSAMTNRGENPQWKPRRSLEFVVAVLITAILTAGYKAHSVALSGGRQVTESNNGENVPPDASKSATLKLSTIARSLGGSAALGL